MAVIDELIKKEADGSISFGNYELDSKAKLDGFEVGGDLYKVKTFKDITKLERNGLFVYESVPGTTVTDLALEEGGMSFKVEGPKDAQITLELEAEEEYEVEIGGSSVGKMKTNLGGKITFGVELEGAGQIAVKVAK
ncbi:MAG: endosialidase [Eubacterium sp.]|nr:endosialidase [Eubacterium sp.]